MANDEILLKVALDLANVKDQSQDLSSLVQKHNSEIQKGNVAMQKQADDTAKAYEAVNKKIKENIGQVANEGKAIETLTKKFDTLAKKNKESFDSKELDEFNKTINSVSASFGVLDQIELTPDDIDVLSQKLATVEDDFEALNVVVEFFESKMSSASANVAASFDDIARKIEETEGVIRATENYIDTIDKAIQVSEPGDGQQKLIAERQQAEKALISEKLALEDYQFQLINTRQESASMETQLRKVKEELIQLELAGGRGSERWEQLSTEAKKYTEVIKNTNAELNRSAKSSAGLDNLIGAATGIVAAFTAAQGAAALFGEENEDLGKSLVKLTGAIALLNGLQQIQVELAKKETIAGKALTFVRTQYAIATDAGAKASLRLAAATKLLGIGLIVGALAAIVVYWKDIAKFIGLTSDATERFNQVNKIANDNYGEQIAKLSILVDRVKEGGLSFDQKKKAVKEFNEVFGKTLGDVKSYTELEQKLIENGANYIKYLGLKATAEAAYQLQIEKSKEALLTRTTEETGIIDQVVGALNPYGASADVVSEFDADKAADKLEKEAAKYGEILNETEKEMEALAKTLGIVLDEPNKDLEKAIKKYESLLEELVKRAQELKTDLIDNERDQEISRVTDDLNAEEEKYRKEIELLKVGSEKKLQLLSAYNKLYNKETGLAYEEYRKTIAEIDQKYDAQIEEVRFKALSAIGMVYDTSEQLEREAIAKKWDAIRKELEQQIKLTNDDFKKQELRTIINFSFNAQGAEEADFDLNTDLDRIDREADIAESILRIYQTNARDIIDNEELKVKQLLNLEKNYLDATLKAYRDSLQTLDDKSIFDGLMETLQTSVDPAELEDAANKLREAFGDKTADEILKTVSALREVSNSIADIKPPKTEFQKVVDDIGEWTSSVEGFSTQLADTLGLEGQIAKEFAEGLAVAIETTWESLQTIFDAEIEEHRNKIESFEESIDAVEQELERERQLYEDGYANNYEERQRDLESLKAQKLQEEEELKKAQKRRAVMAKAELALQSIEQVSNLITASTGILNGSIKLLGPIVGVPVAIALIATMFGAFAVAKAKAFQAIGDGQNFRKGLQEGHLDLHGPRHEERGFGLYNSKTGERIAEFEDSERLYAFNKGQQSKYGHVMEAIMKDAQGRGDLETEIGNHYGIKKTGERTINVIRYVNDITVKAQKVKAQHSESPDKELVNELKSFKNAFSEFKKDWDNETESWETKDYYFVKKGNVTKKYKKE